jgi:hypothetical protein
LEKEEIALLQDDFAALHQEINTEIVNTAPVASSSSSKSSGSIDALDQKLDKFILVYKEKDKMIEEKNKLIFVLQQRL